MGVIQGRNNFALTINPPLGDSVLTTNGSNWLWAVTALYAFSFLLVWAMTFVAKQGEKIFHYIFSITLLVGTIAYFSIASDLAFVVVEQSNNTDRGLTRQIFFSKYVNWVVAFPAITTALGLLSGISWTTIFYWIALSWTWILSYLFSAFTVTDYKWGYYAFGTVAYLLLAVSMLVTDGPQSAKRVGVWTDYLLLASWVNLLFLLYPIAFGLGDGGNRIGVTPTHIFFGVLDVLMLPLVGLAIVIFFPRRWDYSRLNLYFTQYGRVNQQPGNFPEKDSPSTQPLKTEQPAQPTTSA